MNEKQVIDTLIDEGAKLCGQLDRTIIQSELTPSPFKNTTLFPELYYKGLVYFDVPIETDDSVVGRQVVYMNDTMNCSSTAGRLRHEPCVGRLFRSTVVQNIRIDR